MNPSAFMLPIWIVGEATILPKCGVVCGGAAGGSRYPTNAISLSGGTIIRKIRSSGQEGDVITQMGNNRHIKK